MATRDPNSRLEEIIFGTRSDEMCDDRSGETPVTWIARQIRNHGNRDEITDHLQRLLNEICLDVIDEPHQSEHRQALRRTLEITRLTNQTVLIMDLVHLFVRLMEVARDEDRTFLQRLTLQTLADICRGAGWDMKGLVAGFCFALLTHPDFYLDAFEGLREYQMCAIQHLDLLFMLMRIHSVDENRVQRMLRGIRRESETRGYDLTEALAEFMENHPELFSEHEHLLRSTLGQDVLDRALEIRSEGEDDE